MRTILCNNCANVMKRYTTSCTSCRHTDLSYYPDPADPQLAKKRLQVTGRHLPGTQGTTKSIAYVALIIVALAAAGYGFGVVTGHISPTNSVAATSSAVPK